MSALTPSVSALLRSLRELAVRFLLPLLGLALVLTLVEWGLAAFGIHGDVTKWLRMAMIPLYILIAVSGARKKVAESS